MSMARVVGIDIGGTTTRVALVDEEGRILERRRAATDAAEGPEATIATLIRLTSEIVAAASVWPAAIGIGVTGPVDAASGVVSNPHTLGGWPPTDLRTPLETAFRVPVAVDNDANAAAVGEWWAGAGRGARRLAMVTVGTGIGVGLLVEGRVQRAADGRHGEAGHQLLDPNGPACYCGGRGCWETLASGTAMVERARRSACDPSGLLYRLAGGDPSRIDGPMVFAADAAGDEAARAVVDDVAVWLGRGIVNVAAIFMPDIIVLAGGLAQHFDRLAPRIRIALADQARMCPTDVPLQAALCGDDAGPVGAARLAFDRLGAPRAEGILLEGGQP